MTAAGVSVAVTSWSEREGSGCRQYWNSVECNSGYRNSHHHSLNVCTPYTLCTYNVHTMYIRFACVLLLYLLNFQYHLRQSLQSGCPIAAHTSVTFCLASASGYCCGRGRIAVVPYPTPCFIALTLLSYCPTAARIFGAFRSSISRPMLQGAWLPFSGSTAETL